MDLVLVDCNADRALDLAVSNYLEPELAALVNDGAGRFDTVVKSMVVYPQLIDFDLVDLGAGAYEISALHTGSGRVLWITGDPVVPCGFVATNSTASGNATSASTYINLNGNTLPDNVIGQAWEQMTSVAEIWNFMDHNPSWSSSMLQTSGYEVGALAAGDFIGSPAEDLLIALKDLDVIQVFENQNGTLINNYVDVPAGGVGNEPVDLAVGDLNGDTRLDVVSANQGSHSIAVIRNLGDGGFASQTPEPTVEGGNGVPASAPRSVVLGDMDADDDLDVVTANWNGGTSGSVSLFLNDGAGKLMLAGSFPIPVGNGATAVQVGDLNGDGALDIVTANEYVEAGTSSVSVLLATP